MAAKRISCRDYTLRLVLAAGVRAAVGAADAGCGAAGRAGETDAHPAAIDARHATAKLTGGR